MVDFNRAAATAQRLIEENGRPIELVRKNTQAADPEKRWRGPVTTPNRIDGGARIQAIGCFVPLAGSGLGLEIIDTDATLRRGETSAVLIATDSLPETFTPEDVETIDALIDGDAVWKVDGRQHLKPAGRSVMFALALSRTR